MKSLSYLSGSAYPLGALVLPDGVNFSVITPRKKVYLKLFDIDTKALFFSAPMEATGEVKHLFVKGLTPSFAYGFGEKEGPLFLDPYARELTSGFDWGKESNYAPIGKVSKPLLFDWEGIKKPNIPVNELVIYEMHVRGFTKNILSGTFLDLIEKIPHLSSLGVNAVELLPIMEFNECEITKRKNKSGGALYNFWGYSTVNFFSLMQRYAKKSPILEFKTLVKELHKAGIAIILDVVYNHTAEGSEDGPSLSFKWLSPKKYYLLDDEGKLMNFSGTGNTCNCNHEVMKKLIIDSLSYFASEFQIDGFRFDLASVLSRGEKGAPLQAPPVIQGIEHAPALKGTYLIAEPWDAGGLYQVGSFPGGSQWSEWNGKYRDIVRQFIKGDDGMAGLFADALCGSESVYKGKNPQKSINFITSHDGYTLCDLVSYQETHNEDNGENNQDGHKDNRSWNCGVEGETEDAAILSLRKRQQKNFHLALCVSLGIPMLWMGDEYGHTRKGNNNPYCQDNEINWFDWSYLEKNEEHFVFLQKALAFRKRKKSIFCKNTFLKPDEVVWHGKTLNHPDWSFSSHLIVYTVGDCLIAFNASHDAISIELPKEKKWRRVVDTAAKAPEDFLDEKTKKMPLRESYELQPYSAFIAELDS